MTDTIQIGPNVTATQVINAGDGNTLVSNNGPATVYFGDTNAIRAADASGVIPVTSGGYFTVDGKSDLFACVVPGTTAQLSLLAGGLNFFAPTNLSLLGGAAVFVGTTAPTGTIPLNSIWFNTTLNALEYWNGAAWTIQAFSGSELIQAGTIVASLIAAGTVVAGIVNGTTVIANQYIAEGGVGEFLGYSSSTPTLNDLIFSISQIAGTDSPGNAFLGGLASYLDSAGTFYAACLTAGGLTFETASAAGGPWSQQGALFINTPTRLQYTDNSSLIRNITQSASQVSGAVLGNSTTPNTLAGPYNIAPDLGVGDCVEIDLPFNVQMGATTAEGVGLYYNLNGVSNVLLGTLGTLVAAGATYAGNVTLCLKIASTGTSGTCRLWLKGGFYTAGNINTANAGSIASPVLTGVAINTTILNTLQLSGAWTGTGGAGQAFTPLGSTFKIY